MIGFELFNDLVEELRLIPDYGEARLTYIRLQELTYIAHARMAELEILDKEENAQEHLEYLW